MSANGMHQFGIYVTDEIRDAVMKQCKENNIGVSTFTRLLYIEKLGLKTHAHKRHFISKLTKKRDNKK